MTKYRPFLVFFCISLGMAMEKGNVLGIVVYGLAATIMMALEILDKKK